MIGDRPRHWNASLLIQLGIVGISVVLAQGSAGGQAKPAAAGGVDLGRPSTLRSARRPSGAVRFFALALINS